MPLRYDHPNCVVRHSQTFQNVAGASWTGGYFYPWAKCVLINVHGQVITAGTGTTVSAPVIYKMVGTATTALGTLQMGTGITGFTKNLAGTPASPLATLASGDMVWTVFGADAVAVDAITYTYQFLPEAVLD